MKGKEINTLSLPIIPHPHFPNIMSNTVFFSYFCLLMWVIVSTLDQD